MQQRWRPLVGTILLTVALCSLSLLASPAGAQDAPSTTVESLLIEGTAPATTAAPTATTIAVQAEGGDEGGSSSTRLWIAVGLLVLLAVLVAGLTVTYWRMTRPPQRPASAVVDLDQLVRADRVGRRQ